MSISKIHLPSDAVQRMIRQELARFSGLPGSMNIEQLDGYFTALNLSPVDYDIADWLELIWGGGDFPVGSSFVSGDEISQFFACMIQHWRNVETRLVKDKLFMPLAFIERHDGAYWAQGFLQGTQLYSTEWLNYCDNSEQDIEKVLQTQARLRHYTPKPEQKNLKDLNQALIIAVNLIRREYDASSKQKRH